DAGTPEGSAGSGQTNERPNILLIVADDLGYSDIGVFGSEISTPNLDELAADGMVLRNFYTGPTCSVSRSMLMSGVDNHIAGLGNMAETVADNQLGVPGYEGHLNNRVDTIAEVVRPAGYHTYMAGKWHLGMQPEQSPNNRGFEQTFALLYGGASHFGDMTGPDAHRDPALYRENGLLVRELPKDFYSTTFYTDKVISQIDSNIGDGKPFLAFLSYTAPHWPLQAPDEHLDKYRSQYDDGYDAIRERRFAKQIGLGLFPPATQEPPRPAHLRPWDELSVEEQRFHARNMEIYAAMIDHMDMSIGRVLEYLAQQAELDNTIIVFISDNGADPWDYDHSPPAVGNYAAKFDNSAENRGRVGSFVFYGAEWAHVSNTPFTRFKGSAFEGGIRSPAIVYWPAHIKGGQVSGSLTFIADWYPTFAGLAGVSETKSSGKNLLPLLQGTVERVRDDTETVGIEAWGKRGIVGQQFKLVSSPTIPHGRADWELYDLTVDPSEQTDLATDEPEEFAALKQEWDEYQSTNNVILPEGVFKVRPAGEKPTE
ncbi:MAG: arylsulfatase, partial [Gammaproteobacteria bacterium]|nr:arylsulfatase [Gammaproteobacteria bacterium]